MRVPLAGALALAWASAASASPYLSAARLLPSTRLRPGPVTTGDFNRDGKVDIAYGVPFPTGVAVLLGDGQGGYQEAIVTQVATLSQSTAESIVAADLNGDPWPDLVISDFANGPSVYLGLGDGRFAGRSLGGDLLNFDLAVGDFDGDGHRDLALGHRGLTSASQVLVYRGNGAGDFASPVVWTLPVLLFPQGVVAGDFNSDGRDDVAVSDSFGNAVAILLGSAALTPDLRGPFPSGLGTQGLDAGDLDGDGRLDLVAADNGGRTVSIFKGDGAGGLGPAQSIAGPSACNGVLLADFDADGRLDLAASGAGVWIYRGTGAGSFGAPQRFGVEGALAAGRFDGDPHLDLAAGPSLMAGDGAFGFAAQRTYPTAAGPRNGASADFNRDGRDDVATTHANGSVSILLADGAGGLLPPTNLLTGTDPTDVLAGDLDVDGWPDVVVAHAGTQDVVVLRNDHAGGFTRAAYPVGGTPQSLALGDWNGDGRPDVAITGTEAGTVQILRGQPGGTLAPGGVTFVGPSPLALVAGHFNADTRLDLAWIGVLTGVPRLSLLAGTGGETFVPAPFVSLFAAEHALAAADVNGDGYADLLAGGDSQQVVLLPSGLAVRLGDGQGGLLPSILQPNIQVRSLVVRDFTQDGRVDLVVFENRSETVGIHLLQGQGDGRFGLFTESPIPVGGSGTRAFAGDFDGDGRPDVGAVVDAGDTVTLLLNRGATTGTDLSLHVDVDPDPVGQGQPVRYTATVENRGPVTARGVRLGFQTPPGIGVASSTPGFPVCTPAISIGEAGRFLCEIGTLAAGASFAFTVNGQVPPAGAEESALGSPNQGGTLGWADVRATSPDETAPADNFATFVTHGAPVDVGISIADSVDPVAPGQTYRYTMTIVNHGLYRATRAFAGVRLPAGLSSVGLPNGPCFAPDASFVRCVAATVDPGQTVVFEFDVHATFFTSAVLEAEVTCDQHDTDPANDTDVEETRMILAVRGELAHGSQVRRAPAPGTPAEDLFLVRVDAHSSYEMLLDELSGDLTSGPAPAGLERLGPDTVSVLQFSTPSGTGPARVLRWQNTTDETRTQMVRVRSQGCTTDCGPDDTYRLRAYATTGWFARFNTTGNQETVIVLQNPRSTPVTGALWFWSPDGAIQTSYPFVLSARRTLVLNVATMLPASSGSITVTHDGGYAGLAGKAVAIQPATGFSFDTPLLVRPR